MGMPGGLILSDDIENNSSLQHGNKCLQHENSRTQHEAKERQQESSGTQQKTTEHYVTRQKCCKKKATEMSTNEENRGRHQKIADNIRKLQDNSRTQQNAAENV